MESFLSSLLNQSILILGLGREGISTYKFLRKHFPEKKLALSDIKPLEKLDTQLISLLHKDENVVLQLEEKHLNNLSTANIIFKSPGIPASLPPITQALSKNTKLSSNTQLFFDLLQEKNPNQFTIGVTGTKGKSTTAALTHHVLKENDLDVVLLGNIGTPPLSQIDNIKSKTIVVMELSCHQLAELTHSPHVAIIQEITSEHLDYYATVEEYTEAKTAICRYQNSKDIVIYSQKYPTTAEIVKLSPGKHITHSDFISQHSSEQENNPLTENYPDLPGDHNRNNIIPAVIVGNMLDLSSEQIYRAISSFETLPHRLQLVARIDGIRYYNDSLSTTPEATIAALKAFGETPIILIAGGYERDQNFGELAKVILGKKNHHTHSSPEFLDTHVKTLILFPTTGKRLWDKIEKLTSEDILENQISPQAKGVEEYSPNENLPTHFFVENMSEAVEVAKQHAEPGDIVLLSPASASFNLFKDYADRGEKFQQEVKAVK